MEQAGRKSRGGMTGFTLIELMLVTAMIGILASIAIPAYQDYTVRARMAEALPIAAAVEVQIAQYYDRWGSLPRDNAAAGLPDSSSIRGRSFDSIEVSSGVIQIRFSRRYQPSRYQKDTSGSSSGSESGWTLNIYPARNSFNPAGPLTWVCNEGEPTKGFIRSSGSNLISDVPSRYLPSGCRGDKQ